MRRRERMSWLNPMPLHVVPVASPTDLDAFIALPSRLYAGDRRFQPPMTLDRQLALDPAKSAFFSHGEAQYWLALREGELVGRISAQIDHAAQSPDFRGVGLFGCLDAIDDIEVVRALIATAEAWLAGRGMMAIRGPCLLSMNGEAGLLVEGQAEPAMVMVPWHPEYLGPLIEACGYRRARDLHYYRINITPDALEPVARGLRLSARRGSFSVRRLNRFRPGREMELIRKVYNSAWQNNWGFIPLQEADLAAFKTDLRPFMKPDYGTVVEIGGEAVGISLVLPNLAEMSADLGVSPSLFGLIRLLWRATMKRFTSARVILLGINADRARTIEGVAIAMTLVDELVQLAGRYRLASVEAGWVLEDNRPLIAIIEKFRGVRVRTLRVFEKRFSDEAAPRGVSPATAN